jgi:hypothetical protein
MKTRTLIIFGIAFAICMALWLHRSSEPKREGSVQTVAVPAIDIATDRSAMADDPKTQSTNNSPANTAIPNALPPTPVESNGIDSRLLARWQVPIEFYGKVVDENTNLVAGVNIHFRWSEIPAENGMRTADAQSDADGLFSLQGKRGASLTVWFSKDGYYSSGRGQKTFSYALPAAFSADPLNPVVFQLHKKGQAEPLIHIAGVGLHTMRDFLLAADGKPAEVSLHDGRLTPAGQGDLEVTFQAGPPLDNFPSRITWQCQVTIPNGGLIQTDEEFPFLAPDNGYQASGAWSVTATNWNEEVDKQYYVKLRDGNFGRVKLRIIGAQGRAFFRMESFLNPSGSRNLEPQ